MTKKISVSSAQGRQTTKRRKPTLGSLIDYSDIPASTPGELKKAFESREKRKKTAKQLIAIRIAPQVLHKLRKLAVIKSKPYQTLIHEILEKATKRVA